MTDQKITSTPLLEYLANVRQERRDERKRKIEDRKRQREEDKQRKKNQLVKSMPKTIEEDAKVCIPNDDRNQYLKYEFNWGLVVINYRKTMMEYLFVQ